MARHRLYFDESGNHSFKRLETAHERYLALCGVMFEDTEYQAFQTDWERMKRRFFDGDLDEPIIPHRKELMAKSGLFSVLEDDLIKSSFNAEFLAVVGRAKFTSIIVVIDKAKHQRTYSQPMNPYHYCLVALLERYCFWLHPNRGDVVGEARGKNEDQQLKAAYAACYSGGEWNQSAEFYQKHLTSKEIKLFPKSKNVAGLQLADLLAHPAKTRCIINHSDQNREFSESPFGTQLADLFWQKIRKSPAGNPRGWGEIFI
jgi:hypothetical protein